MASISQAEFQKMLKQKQPGFDASGLGGLFKGMHLSTVGSGGSAFLPGASAAPVSSDIQKYLRSDKPVSTANKKRSIEEDAKAAFRRPAQAEHSRRALDSPAGSETDGSAAFSETSASKDKASASPFGSSYDGASDEDVEFEDVEFEIPSDTEKSAPVHLEAKAAVTKTTPMLSGRRMEPPRRYHWIPNPRVKAYPRFHAKTAPPSRRPWKPSEGLVLTPEEAQAYLDEHSKPFPSEYARLMANIEYQHGVDDNTAFADPREAEAFLNKYPTVRADIQRIRDEWEAADSDALGGVSRRDARGRFVSRASCTDW
jgi:hypothetical protein